LPGWFRKMLQNNDIFLVTGTRHEPAFQSSLADCTHCQRTDAPLPPGLDRHPLWFCFFCWHERVGDSGRLSPEPLANTIQPGVLPRIRPHTDQVPTRLHDFKEQAHDARALGDVRLQLASAMARCFGDFKPMPSNGGRLHRNSLKKTNTA
jgi:hypothetical protein